MEPASEGRVGFIHNTRPMRLFMNLSLLVAGIATAAVLAAMRLRSQPARHHFQAGLGYIEQNDGRAAEREWKRTLDCDPGFLDARRMMVELYMTSHQWRAAEEAITELIRRSPREPHAYCRRGEARWKRGNDIGALADAKEELKLDGKCVRALLTAGVLAGQTSDQRSALTHLRTLAQVKNREPEVWLLLGRALARAGEFAEARQVLTKVIAWAQKSEEAHYLIGLCCARDTRLNDGPQQAEEHFIATLRINPVHAGARVERGRIYLSRGESRKAVLQLREAALSLPNQASVFYDLAKAYEDIGNHPAAARARERFAKLSARDNKERELLKRVAADRTDFVSLLGLGTIKMEKGELALARSFLISAQRLRPDDARARDARQRLDRLVPGNGDAPDALPVNR